MRRFSSIAVMYRAVLPSTFPRARRGAAGVDLSRAPGESPAPLVAKPLADLVRFPVGRRVRSRLRRLPVWIWIVLAAVATVAALVSYEARTSALEARLLSYAASRLTYSLGPGPSPRIVIPIAGPSDERRGYTRVGEFAGRLDARSYRVAEQARFSKPLERAARSGITPPYRDPGAAGLYVRGEGGVPVYDATRAADAFARYEEIPPLLARSLLYIEDRRLDEPSDPRANPVVDWPRLAKATLLYGGRKLGLPLRLEGASTLATQIDKFRHSPGGITRSATDKLKQMLSASLLAYSEGEDTRAERHEILLEYLNHVPLAAAPGFGEVHGIGQGLKAWFGLPLDAACAALAEPGSGEAKVRAYKLMLALLCAAHAPTRYLVADRDALRERVDYFTRKLQGVGAIDAEFSRRLLSVPIAFLPRDPAPPRRLTPRLKTAAFLRARLADMLDVHDFYDLDQLDLDVRSTIDVGLTRSVEGLFQQLRDPAFLDANGLRGEHLLSQGDPGGAVYGFLLLERTRRGDLLRVHLDTLDQPFDVNEGMKMELGSTAKLRTLANYLEIVADLHGKLSKLDPGTLALRARVARDPITAWAAQTLLSRPGIGLEAMLRAALERRYSASPGEVFFTAGGDQTFRNYDPREDGGVYSVREGLVQSINLVYVRLMRDIVRYYEARLPYDPTAVLQDPVNPGRERLLEEIADSESRGALTRAYLDYHGLDRGRIVARLLGSKVSEPRELSLLFFAWHPGASREALAKWIEPFAGEFTDRELEGMVHAYGNPRLTIADFGWLLGRPPLEVWTAGELAKDPGLSLDDLMARGAEARRIASEWLFKTRNRHAQDIRLRTRIEEDAFALMTPYWRKLGFPFPHLLPSLATAIGASCDRPAALVDLMGIILNGGMREPPVLMPELRFASGTPYQTVLRRVPPEPEREMDPTVARLLREVMIGVVTEGTARRLDGAFERSNGGALPVGGKTGSGDNREYRIGPGGERISSTPMSRTAAFVFYVGERWYGIITASVTGERSGSYSFTSAYPVAILGLLAPYIEATTPRGTDLDRDLDGTRVVNLRILPGTIPDSRRVVAP